MEDTRLISSSVGAVKRVLKQLSKRVTDLEYDANCLDRLTAFQKDGLMSTYTYNAFRAFRQSLRDLLEEMNDVENNFQELKDEIVNVEDAYYV